MDLVQRIGRHGLLTNRVLEAYWLSDDDDRADGITWYDAALAEACLLDQADGRRGAGVIAALSPLAPWGKNLERARLAFERGTAEGLTFGQHTRKADRILAGEAPLDVLGGQKVRNFYGSIMAYDRAVCIDRHAFDIVMGHVTTHAEKKVLDVKGGYEWCAGAYIEAADMLGMAPRILQAITWVSWRRRKGVTWADQQNGA